MPNEMTAGEAAEILENMAEKDFQSDGTHFEADENIAINYAASILRRVASGELTEVVHAHWFEDTEPADGDIRCSNCGIAWPICVQKYLQHVGVKKWTNFLKICPDCGALMDEKDDSDG